MNREYRMSEDKIYIKSPILQHSLIVIHYSLFKNYFLPKNGKISNGTTYYLLPTTYYLLRHTTYYLLLTTYYAILPTTPYYLLPTIYYLLLTTYDSLTWT
jgi:hypothetical protein